MATPIARKRLTKELMAMKKEPPPFILAQPEEKNILDWHFIIRGPPDSPYAGGEYHGLLMFPSEYPFKPPDIKMYTPSGRFEPGVKICMSMTSYHKAEWNAAWSVATILTGMLSFMLTDEVTTGGIKTTEAVKKDLAQKSHQFNIDNRKFREVFPEYAEPTMKDLPVMGATGPPAKTAPPADPSAPVISSDTAPDRSPADPSAVVAGLTGSDVGKTDTDEAASGQAAIEVLHAPAPLPPRSWFSRWRWVLAAFAVIILGRISKF